jgi:hypothetical protein
LFSVNRILRWGVLAAAATAVACDPFRMVDLLQVGPFIGKYHIVALSAPTDTAFTGTFTLTVAGNSQVTGSGTLSNLGDVRVIGVVHGDSLEAGLSQLPDDGICLSAIRSGADLVGTWQACGFPPNPPPHGTFTARRS